MRFLKNRGMNILNGVAVTGFLLAVCGSAIASISTGHNVNANRGTRTQPSEAVTSQVQQTDNSAREAEVWGLSDTQWQQYRDVMKGPRGVQSPGIDPVLALGLEAESAAERRYMADLWVKQEYQRVEKELAFQREVDAAWKRLYPGVLPVNMGRNVTGVAHDTRGRLALFVRRENCPQCDARLAAIIADNRPVDIYVVDSRGSDDVIRQWALTHHIPVDRVRSHRITLNHDNGNWLKFGQGRMPVVLQQGGSGWQIAAF
ncbi:TIGR03759 family integrating conjugative element protein [Salmonella enterica subsp. enterica serovar Chester]|nr:TIGR03759 family integrating conjugative element protein [Salmonella enterica subsp. enterica serovar Chester]EHZ1826446.1 TIGR03759 family integrating conjugative element protein [Salmonella enterica subsp. enterica serovar Chester]